MAELIISLPGQPPRRHNLTRDAQVIGRVPMCDVFLDDPSASRRHAQIRFHDGRYIVEDLESKNGTLVNSIRVGSKELKDGDEIVIGSVSVKFYDPDQAPPGSTVVVTDADTSTDATSYSGRNAALLLSQQRLQMLYELSERLTTLRHQQELLDDALNICFDTLRFERGAIAVRKSGGRGVEWPAVRNLRGAGGEMMISRSILGRALDHGERAIINESDPEMKDPTVSVVQHGIRSAMCVPLMHGDENLGVIYGDRVTTGTVYTQGDVDFLAGLARQVTIGLINARLLEEHRAKLALEAELHLARQIQRGLFPASLPEHERISAAALNDPGRLVSGDYYDVLELTGDRVGFIIADVTGKGAAASLLMSNLQAAVRMTMPGCDDLGDLMARWNRQMYVNTDASKFVTCLVGIVDPAARKVIISTAGHHMPFVIYTDPNEYIEVTGEVGFPLGVVDNAEYATLVVPLQERPCLIFCYTDGVIEAMDGADEPLGRAPMVEVMAGLPDLNPQGMIDRMRRAVAAHCGQAPQSDDITMMALRLT